MWTVIGIVLFMLALLFSIAWHELGHLTFAKLFNVRTTQYMVGFRQDRLVQADRGDRVRVQGDPARRLHPDDRHGAARQGRQAEDHHHRDGRRRHRPQHRRGDQGRRSLAGHRRRRGSAVLPAAPVQADRRHGRRAGDEPDPGRRHLRGPDGRDRCADRRPRRLPPSASASFRPPRPVRPSSTDCTATDPQTPAALAGLLPGDTIVGFDGTPVTGWAQLTDLIQAAAGIRPCRSTTSATASSTPRPWRSWRTSGPCWTTTASRSASKTAGFLGISVTAPYAAAVDRRGDHPDRRLHRRRGEGGGGHPGPHPGVVECDLGRAAAGPQLAGRHRRRGPDRW